MRDIFQVPNDIRCVLRTFYHDLSKPAETLGELSIHSREVGKSWEEGLCMCPGHLKDMRVGKEGDMERSFVYRCYFLFIHNDRTSC